MKTGIQLIAEERQRQVSKGWNASHDDCHINHEITVNASFLVLHGTDCAIDEWRPNGRPDWGLVEKYKSDRILQLTVAGALIAAEIDRLQRAARAAQAQKGAE